LALTAPAPERLYIGLDGTQAHIDGAWHEVKTAVIYEGVAGEDGLSGPEKSHIASHCLREPTAMTATDGQWEASTSRRTSRDASTHSIRTIRGGFE